MLLLPQRSRIVQTVFLSRPSNLGGRAWGVGWGWPCYPAANLLCSQGFHGWCNLNCPHLCVGGRGPVGPGPVNGALSAAQGASTLQIDSSHEPNKEFSWAVIEVAAAELRVTVTAQGGADDPALVCLRLSQETGSPRDR